MTPHALDTTAEGRAVQRTAHATLGPEGRLRTALEMSESVRQIRLAGLQERWPEVGQAELIRRFVLEVHGVG